MAFDPNEVKVSYLLNLGQVNLVLEGLSKLPYERVDQFIASFRKVAEVTLKEASDLFEKSQKAEQEEPKGEE